jgi:RNA polymerase sigma factor (sigma-70 family)
MAGSRSGWVAHQLRTLWTVGVGAEADDAALIARFLSRRDDAAEVAFRLLVERHGPMVQRVCRQVIGDSHIAQDAAQAVFLVFARKAGSIRIDTTTAPWLHGVARRVAAKARSRVAARRAGEERAAVAIAAVRTEVSTTRDEIDWEAVHDEVARLPEKYRTPIVLCYLEGLTYEETARRIGCPVGTVRVRLSRARDRLRKRLTRRGFGPALHVLSGESDEARQWVPPALAAGWVEKVVQSAVTWEASRAVSGTVPALALTLSEEVIRMMTLAKWKAVAVMAAVALTSAGALVFAAGGSGQAQKEPGRGVFTPPAAKVAPTPVRVPPTEKDDRQRLLETARKRLQTQRAYYEEGRITIDRYLDASQQLFSAELGLSRTPETRAAAAKAHLDRLDEIVTRERAELEAGRGTSADVSEAEMARAPVTYKDFQEMVVHPAVPPHPSADQIATGKDVQDLRKRVEVLEKQLEKVSKVLGLHGIDID